jgi:ATP-dependent Zn protease
MKKKGCFMLNNNFKNKLVLSILMVLNVFAIHGAPAIVVQSNGVETVLNLRQTIPERVKLAWKKVHPKTKSLLFGAAYTLAMTAIVMRMQNNELSPKNFKLAKSSDIDTTFDKIIGAQKPKTQINRFINYIKNAKPFKNIGAKPLKGFVLHGPPGTGKTDLARATAKEAGVDFIHTTGSEFNGVWRGSGVQQVKALHKFAKEKAPCVVFIDEIDGAVGSSKGGTSWCSDNKSTTNAFKTMLDGFVKQDSSKPILFIGATNNLDDIDSAIIRDGRLTPIYVGTPNAVELSQIFKSKLYNSEIQAEQNIDTLFLANLLSGGSTGANVEAIVNDAANIAIDNNKTIVDFDSLKSAIAARG